MRIYVFEEDPSLLKLLTLFLEKNGHQVRGFPSEYSCPLCQSETDVCFAEKPCADAVIVNTRSPDQEKFQLLIEQNKKGCKLPNINKALMSTTFTDIQKKMICDQGFHLIKKPFRLAAITNWIKECSDRLK